MELRFKSNSCLHQYRPRNLAKERIDVSPAPEVYHCETTLPYSGGRNFGLGGPSRNGFWSFPNL